MQLGGCRAATIPDYHRIQENQRIEKETIFIVLPFPFVAKTLARRLLYDQSSPAGRNRNQKRTLRAKRVSYTYCILANTSH
jgi:hypothetical protein